MKTAPTQFAPPQTRRLKPAAPPLHPTPNPRHPTCAFSLIELLVVISIITLLLLITFPALNVMQESTSLSSAVNSIGTAVNTTRLYAARNIQFTRDEWPGDTYDTYTGHYDGCALVFMPYESDSDDDDFVVDQPEEEVEYIQMILVQNDENLMYDSDTPFELRYVDDPDDTENAYSRISDIDPIQLPPRIGVLGISRGSSGTEYLAPPFAIHFDENGILVPGRVLSDNGVHYNMDQDNDITVGDETSDAMHAVIGVIVFDRQSFIAANSEISPDQQVTNSDAISWLQENGEIVLFSRYTGTPIRP